MKKAITAVHPEFFIIEIIKRNMLIIITSPVSRLLYPADMLMAFAAPLIPTGTTINQYISGDNIIDIF
jgi:hypothetical protein